jgi:hypothetical protein
VYNAEDGHLLVDALGFSDPPSEENHRRVIDELIAWLKQLKPENQRKALDGLMRAVAVAQVSPAKGAVIEALDGMSDDDAMALASSTSDVRRLVHVLAELPTQTRARLIAFNFSCISAQ